MWIQLCDIRLEYKVEEGTYIEKTWEDAYEFAKYCLFGLYNAPMTCKRHFFP